MVCPEVKAIAAVYHTEGVRSEQSVWRANMEAKRLQRILQPRNSTPSEAVEGILLSADLLVTWGKLIFCRKKRLRAL
jgi:hypothetical protein